MLRQSETLARVPLFRSLPKESIVKLDSQCIWRRAQEGEWVLNHQQAGNDLFFITQGHVRVTIRPISGADVILRDIRDGEYFGELAAIDGQPRSAGILAVTASVIARMSAKVFRAAVHSHPDVCDQLLELLASQVRILSNRVNEFTSLDVPRRIHAELLRLARPVNGGDPVISPPPTHAELAARVSTHREAVTRELNSLERAGFIERRRGAIVLKRPDELAAKVRLAAR